MSCIMAFRKIVKIDEEKYNGCGFRISQCAKGALQIIDGKVRLIEGNSLMASAPVWAIVPRMPSPLEGRRKRQLSWEMKGIKPESPR
jgi:hypothetical protein